MDTDIYQRVLQYWCYDKSVLEFEERQAEL